MTMMIIMIKMVTQWCQETRGRALSPVWSSRQPTGGRWCSREAPGWINQVIIIIINDIIILFTWWGTWSNQVINSHFKVDGMEDGIMQSDEIINRWRVEKKDDDGYLVQEYWPEWWMTSDKWQVQRRWLWIPGAGVLTRVMDDKWQVTTDKCKEDDDGYLVQDYWPEWWMTSDKWQVTSDNCKEDDDGYLVQEYWPEWWMILLLLVRPTGRTFSLSSTS